MWQSVGASGGASDARWRGITPRYGCLSISSWPIDPQVFRRIITGSGESINRLLRRTKAPLLLLWGDKVRC